MKKEMNNKGFSLVELIVVIAIMAVLMAVLAPSLLRYVENSRKQKDDSAAAEVLNAVEIALADEEINAEAGSGYTITVTSDASTGVATINCNSHPLMEAELTASIGSFKLSSKTYGNGAGTYTITIADDGSGAMVASGTW